MAAPSHDDERLEYLLVTRAVEGLSKTEQHELDELVERNPGIDLEEVERVAASLAIAGLRVVERLPAALRGRLEADAEAWFARQD